MEGNIIQSIKPVTMSAREAAKYIGISYWLLLDMVKKDQVPFIKCGNRKLFRKVALDKWMEQQEKLSGSNSNEYGVLRKIE